MPVYIAAGFSILVKYTRAGDNIHRHNSDRIVMMLTHHSDRIAVMLTISFFISFNMTLISY